MVKIIAKLTNSKGKIMKYRVIGIDKYGYEDLTLTETKSALKADKQSVKDALNAKHLELDCARGTIKSKQIFILLGYLENEDTKERRYRVSNFTGRISELGINKVVEMCQKGMVVNATVVNKNTGGCYIRGVGEELVKLGEIKSREKKNAGIDEEDKKKERRGVSRGNETDKKKIEEVKVRRSVDGVKEKEEKKEDIKQEVREGTVILRDDSYAIMKDARGYWLAELSSGRVIEEDDKVKGEWVQKFMRSKEITEDDKLEYYVGKYGEERGKFFTGIDRRLDNLDLYNYEYQLDKDDYAEDEEAEIEQEEGKRYYVFVGENFEGKKRFGLFNIEQNKVVLYAFANKVSDYVEEGWKLEIEIEGLRGYIDLGNGELSDLQ